MNSPDPFDQYVRSRSIHSMARLMSRVWQQMSRSRRRSGTMSRTEFLNRPGPINQKDSFISLVRRAKALRAIVQ